MSNRISNRVIWAEMARRKIKFHATENWQDIRLWGLFRWGGVKHLLDKGLLLTNMKKSNVTIWVWPSEEAYYQYIEPLLDTPIEQLEHMAGW